MLRGLEIRDILIIDRLELRFQPGLNVLTGETGAGKSILLDILGFVLGWRGRAELVRKGASQGEVLAEFDLPAGHPARAVLREAGLPEEDSLLLRRVNTVDGRKTAWVNDRRCSGDVLRQLSESLVELHGQHDDRGLLDARGHRRLLDTFGQLDPLVDATRSRWRALRQAQTTLDAAQAALAQVAAEEEFLRHAVAELDKLAPQPGEEEALDSRRRLMQSAARIREDITRAHAALSSDGAEAAMGNALRWVEGVADRAGDVLNAPIDALGRALGEVADAIAGLEAALDQLAFNAHELEELEERLFAIRGLARKHQIAPEDLPAFAEDLRMRLARLDAGAGDLAALSQAVAQAEAQYEHAAQALSAARSAAALRLDQAVMGELAPLRMERAVFETQITPADPGPEGCDMVAFSVATNPGAPAGPLGKIASGGELSRFMLALKVCLVGEHSSATMIFDEIDRGVGGATADAVGRRLAALAEGGQVLVVTHSPQVAALGAHHWRVEKRVVNDLTLSTITPLADGARIDEIARMVSGDTITDEARAAARALLQG
jgi:DNA repair protein RecN (Recombination protein N)